MKRVHMAATVAVTLAVVMTACNRTTEPQQDATAEDRLDQRQDQEEEALRLEQRLSELDREWQQAQAELKGDAAAATNAVKAEIQEDLTNARQAIADLRTTTAENWWDRHERVVQQTVDEVEADVKRFARRWSPPAEATVGTVGAEATWTARRDQLVARLEARIEAMQRALEDVNARGTQQREVEDTRDRINKLKDDAGRLRTASEADWWDISRERVAEYVDRLEASIDRVRENIN